MTPDDSQRGASPAPALVVVALGSNLGDSAATLTAALRRLACLSQGAGGATTPGAPDEEFNVKVRRAAECAPYPGARGFRASSLWRSSPVDCPTGSPAFVNAVCVFEPSADATPESLLGQLQRLEREFGRRPKSFSNEPRPLDLDLIAFGQETRDSPALVLPHPRAHLRRFVLQPLCELAPDLILPGWDRSAADQLAVLDSGEVLARIPPRT